MSKKVFVTDRWFDDYQELVDRAAALGGEVVFASAKDEDTLIREGSDAVCIVNTSAQCTTRFIQSLTNCRTIVRTGIGFDTVDVAAATEKGISVCNVPDYCRAEVANHTVTLALAVIRKLRILNEEVRSGKWVNSDLGHVPRLGNSVFGLLGFGGIAQQVAKRLSAFGVHIMAYDPYLPQSVFEDYGVERATVPEDIYRKADAILLHMPLTDETRHMINRETIAMMKDQVFIINTARGPLIDETALIEGLESGKICGAGLDVVETEPLPVESPLNRFHNVIVTPHAGYYSTASLPDLYDKVIDEVERGLKGSCNRMIVNRKALGL